MTAVSLYGADAAARAADAIRARVGDEAPVAGLILGSGLGGLVDRLESRVDLRYDEIPGVPAATVKGHAGLLATGRLAGQMVVAFSGRFHMYEGHSPALTGFPVRVLHALGAPNLVVTNAAGGIRRSFHPGTLMLIRDHINLLFQNPLIGAHERGDARFPDLSEPYDPDLRRFAWEAASACQCSLEEGVYAAFLGPTYETPAEVRMLAALGADAVGMSTVPEVLVARAIGMRVVGISCITNLASGISPMPLSHREVLETTARAANDLEQIVRGIVERV